MLLPDSPLFNSVLDEAETVIEIANQEVLAITARGASKEVEEVQARLETLKASVALWHQNYPDVSPLRIDNREHHSIVQNYD